MYVMSYVPDKIGVEIVLVLNTELLFEFSMVTIKNKIIIIKNPIMIIIFLLSIYLRQKTHFYLLWFQKFIIENGYF